MKRVEQRSRIRDEPRVDCEHVRKACCHCPILASALDCELNERLEVGRVRSCAVATEKEAKIKNTPCEAIRVKCRERLRLRIRLSGQSAEHRPRKEHIWRNIVVEICGQRRETVKTRGQGAQTGKRALVRSDRRVKTHAAWYYWDNR